MTVSGFLNIFQSPICITIIVVMIGAGYPLVLKWTKQGESIYPFMIGVAICIKNILMLAYYIVRFLVFQYQRNENSRYTLLHPSISSLSQIYKPQDVPPYIIPMETHQSPAAISNLHIFEGAKSKFKRMQQSMQQSNIDSNDDDDSDDNKKAVELTSINGDNLGTPMKSLVDDNGDIDDIDGDDFELSDMSVEIDAPLMSSQFRLNFKNKLKLYFYLAPNALLVLINDVLALYTLSFVTVSTYAIFMQISLIFIVFSRFCFLGKSLYKSQFVSVIISICGMFLFKITEINTSNQSSLLSGDLIGIALCTLRGFLKAFDLVYVEWFTHHLVELEFYEKQAIVSVWFVFCSIVYTIFHHFNDIFIIGRPLLDGFALSTWVFVIYGTCFAILIYLLILRLDSLFMGFCQQITVLFAVALDVAIFNTHVSFGMWTAAIIVVLSISQFSLIQHEQNRTRTMDGPPRSLHTRTSAPDPETDEVAVPLNSSANSK